MNTPYSTLSRWTARQVITATIFVMVVFLGFWLIYRYHMVLVVLFISIVLGTALTPLVKAFGRLGWSRPIGLSAAYLMLFLLFVALMVIVVPTVVRQALDLADSLPRIYLQMRGTLLESPSIFLRNLGLYAPAELSSILDAAPAGSQPLTAVSTFMSIMGGLFNALFASGAIFLLTTFWVLENERTVRGLLILAPAAKRPQILTLWQDIEARLASFVRGQLILVVSIGVMALIAYLIIGLPNALVLAVLAGIFEAVPVLGPTLGAIPALIIAYSVNPVLAVWVLVSTATIQSFENYVLVPRVMGASVGVNPILTLLILVGLGSLLGLPGALLAIPSAAVVQLLAERFVLSRELNIREAPAGRDLASALRFEVQELISDVHKQLRKKEERSSQGSDQLEDAIEAAAEELDGLLNQEVEEGQG